MILTFSGEWRDFQRLLAVVDLLDVNGNEVNFDLNDTDFPKTNLLEHLMGCIKELTHDDRSFHFFFSFEKVCV